MTQEVQRALSTLTQRESDNCILLWIERRACIDMEEIGEKFTSLVNVCRTD